MFAALSSTDLSVPLMVAGFSARLSDTGVSTVAASLAVAASEPWLAAARVEVAGAGVEAVVAAGVEAGLELNSALFVTGRAVSGNEPTFSGFTVSSAFGAGCAVSSALAAALLDSDCSLTSCAAPVCSWSTFVTEAL